MLFGITWIIGLQEPIFTLPFGDASEAEGTGHMFDPAISWRDIILIGGGLFLIFKATREIHQEIEHEEHVLTHSRVRGSLGQVIAQIALIDIVFSIDSILTAIGMADDIPVMIAAVDRVDRGHVFRFRRRSPPSSSATRRPRCWRSLSCS